MVGEGEDDIVNSAFLDRFGFVSEDGLEDLSSGNLLDRDQLMEQFKAHHFEFLKPLARLGESE